MRFKKFFGKMMIAVGVAAMTFTFAGSTALADGVNTDFDIIDEDMTEFNIPSSLRVGGLYYYYAPGILSGKRKSGVTVIAPNDSATRAQCAMFLMRYYRKPNYVVYH